jgi:hypothetical protein
MEKRHAAAKTPSAAATLLNHRLVIVPVLQGITGNSITSKPNDGRQSYGFLTCSFYKESNTLGGFNRNSLAFSNNQ